MASSFDDLPFFQKRNAPAPPPSQSIYGTLPHAQRNSQNADSIEFRSSNKNQSEIYSTLPHLRNTGFHIDNKAYERFEPLITASQQAKYDKHKYKYEQTEQQPILTTFGHKRSPSGDSLGRNINLAGAKLVLPTGEIPMLKPVDKNLIRPKLPPPGPPSNNGSGLCSSFPFKLP